MLYIFTLNHNGLTQLTKLKNSLIPCLNGIDYVWWIKDNGSTDKTIEIASNWDKNIKVIDFIDNSHNFAQGNNFLFEQIKWKNDDLVLLLNNDIEFKDTESIKKMISLINEPNVGIVGARLLFPNTNLLQHAGVVFSKNYIPCHNFYKAESNNYTEQNRCYPAVTGALLLIRVQDYQAVGGLDEKYEWGYEDIDLCLKVRFNLHKDVVYCGETNIWHESSATLEKVVNKTNLDNNKTRLFKKWDNEIARLVQR